MTISETPLLEDFEQQVRDCLAHLYDFAFLQNHPLVQQLLPDLSGANRVQKFRELINVAIESLRPPPEIDFHAKQARLYNILALRYIEQQQAQEVIQQLALSDRQFYRDHPKAIELISQLLRDRLGGAAVLPASVPETQSPPAVSVESETRRLHSAREQQVNLEEVLQGAVASLRELAAEHEVDIAHYAAMGNMTVTANRTILRQAILWILTQLTVQAHAGSHIAIASEINANAYRIQFTLSHIEDLTPLQEALTHQETLKHFVDTLEGTLQFSEESPFGVTLEIPLWWQTILLIDDNPDMLALFQRYLAGHSYMIQMAQSGDQAIQVARSVQPHVIILDLMLPGQDGFEVLQILKTHHSTQHIPVLVCSVLEMPDLTRSLGANAYLKKPPGQAELLKLLAQWRD